VKSLEVSLSFRALATAQCSATALAIALWICSALIGGFGLQIALAGVAEAGVVLVASLVVLILFSPSKQRPIATVATLWSVASFVRFIVALLSSSLLYYVAQFGLRPLMFSFLLTAVFLLVAETKSLSTSLSKLGQQPSE
jgi:hypothetical protein